MTFSIIEIKEIVSVVSAYENMNYSGYSISFMKRRLIKIFEMYNIKRIPQFYEMLKDTDTREKIICEILVDTTEMFRDPAFWRYLRDNILKTMQPETTIWLPSENTPHEALSLSIILNEQNLNNDIKILCNNPTQICCNNIREGIIQPMHFEINQMNYKRLENFDLFENYFTKEVNYYKADKKLTDNILCKRTDFSNAINDEKVGMILSRNQALCYNHNFSEQYFEILYEKLVRGGFWAVGIKEKLPVSIEERMRVVSDTEKIYKKI